MRSGMPPSHGRAPPYGSLCTRPSRGGRPNETPPPCNGTPLPPLPPPTPPCIGSPPRLATIGDPGDGRDGERSDGRLSAVGRQRGSADRGVLRCGCARRVSARRRASPWVGHRRLRRRLTEEEQRTGRGIVCPSPPHPWPPPPSVDLSPVHVLAFIAGGRWTAVHHPAADGRLPRGEGGRGCLVDGEGGRGGGRKTPRRSAAHQRRLAGAHGLWPPRPPAALPLRSPPAVPPAWGPPSPTPCRCRRRQRPRRQERPEALEPAVDGHPLLGGGPRRTRHGGDRAGHHPSRHPPHSIPPPGAPPPQPRPQRVRSPHPRRRCGWRVAAAAARTAAVGGADRARPGAAAAGEGRVPRLPRLSRPPGCYVHRHGRLIRPLLHLFLLILLLLLLFVGSLDRDTLSPGGSHPLGGGAFTEYVQTPRLLPARDDARTRAVGPIMGQ